MASSRRIPRSRRLIGATGLLISAALVTVVAIIVSTVPILVVATVYATVAGVIAARLMSDELAQLRRDWSHDRARVAHDNRSAAIERSHEHIAFAEQMGARIRLRDAQLAALRDSLVTAEIELARARERVSAERARSAALQSDVESACSDLESARADLRIANDQLAASETAELHARAQLLAWEEAASEEARRQHDRSA